MRLDLFYATYIRDVRTRICWRPRPSSSVQLRPRPQDSVDNRPRTSADVQRLIARCQSQSSNQPTCTGTTTQGRGLSLLREMFHHEFAISCHRLQLLLQFEKKNRALLRNHDFSGACPRPQLNKILCPRPHISDVYAYI